MNNTIKPYIFAVGIFLMAALGVSALLFAFSYGKSVYPARAFSIEAQGKATVIPDIARLNFSVLTEGGTDLIVLQQKNTQKANDAIAFAKDQGIDEKDIKTSVYNIQPRYQYSRCFEGDTICPPPEIVGYSITQTVELKIRDFEKIGTMLAGLVDKGANTVSGVSFGVDDPEVVQNKARGEAIQKAKEKAKALAKSGGFRIGKLLSIEEGSGVVPFYSFETAGKGGASLPEPRIEPGSQEIVVNVILRFELL